jgi:glycosyltransferase involved in cell wall biosynthesis
MKNKINIYLQYPWKFKDSPYYKYLLENPPSRVKYSNISKQNPVILDKKLFWIFDRSKKIIKRILHILDLERPNTRFTKNANKYDLIHCAHCLSSNKNKNWVADIEMYGSLFIAKKRNDELDNEIKKIILSKNCKKIMPWTEGIKKSIVERISGIEGKMEVVYPAIPEIKNLKKEKKEKQRVIFISRYFFTKGGLMVLEIMKKLLETLDIECIIISNVPEKIKKRYPRIKFYNLLPQKTLFEIMKDSDLFLYPSLSETFGFSLLEAMSFGIPVITVKTEFTNSIEEIITHGKTGLIEILKKTPHQKKITSNEKEIIENLFKNCVKILKNKKLLKKMSNNCLEEISKGKFSIKERNKKLNKIYEEALK